MMKSLFIFVVCVGLIISSGYSSLVAKNDMPGSRGVTDVERKAWPKTVDAAVTEIVSGLSEHDRRLIVGTEEGELIMFHHGWGTGIRNSFGLWRGNVALLESCGSSNMHPDAASGVIIEAVWKRLRAEADPRFLKELAIMHATAKAISLQGPNYHWTRIEKAVADMNLAAASFLKQHESDSQYAPLRVEIAGAITPDWPVVFEQPTQQVSVYVLLRALARGHGFEIIYEYPVVKIYREKA